MKLRALSFKVEDKIFSFILTAVAVKVFRSSDRLVSATLEPILS